MRSNRLKSIVAMAAMTGVVSMTSTGHAPNKVNKKLLASTTLATNNSSSSNINPDDLNIQISNVSITKESTAGFTNNTNYVPENNIPKTTNIATTGTEVIYKIAVSLSSKTGKLYNIPKLYLTANPFAEYMDENSNDPKEKEAAAELLKSINVQLGELKNLNSTSTFVITAILRVESSDWNVKVKPNLSLNVMVGDKERVVPIQAPDIRLTKHYTDNVYAGLRITHSDSNKHESYLDIGLSNANSAPNDPGIYNPANYKPQSITFKINNPDPKDLDIIPLNVEGFTVNSNGTYTINSNLIGHVNRLFKVITKTNGVLNKQITVTPISEKYNTNIDLNKTTTFNYDSASATLEQNAIGDSFTMSQDTRASSWYAPYDTFSSELSGGVPGRYKIYSGSLLSNGDMVLIDGKDFIGIKDQTYVSLNENAQNILLTGTASQKASVFQRIVSGDMAGLGQSFSYDQIEQMYKSGEKLPPINFTYKSEDYNGNPLKMVGYYHEIPISGAWTPMINRVYTLGILQGNYSKQERENIGNAIGNGGLSSDTIIKNNGEFSGFLLSPPDNITNQDMYESKPVETPAGGGTYHTTEIRYGSISHDISSVVTYANEKITTTIDSPKGSGNIIQNHPVSWLDNPHKFYFYLYGYGSGVTEQYTKDTVLNVNMDAPFVLTSPVTINGVTVPKEDCKIEGNRLLIKFPQRFNMSPQPRVEFEAHYITFGPQTITVSAHLEGKVGHQGIVYNYNNNHNASQLAGGAASQVVLFNNQVLTGTTSSDCMHYANNIDSDDNVNLTDVIHNGKYEKKTYVVVGQIPTIGSDNLPGNEGSPSVGGLGSTLLSLDTNGAPTWVLPKSALNATNQEILNNTNALSLKGKLEYIESPGSGWVKYVPGKTDLSDMVAYTVTPTIEPGQDFDINYNIHLTGVNPTTYQIVNSAFKYFIPSDDIGSTSNIVNLTPPGENLSYDWISKVVDSNGHAIPSNILNNTIEYNGQKISLNNLIGHGADNDGNFDLTPTSLQEKVDLATNKEAMQKLGYKLDGIYVDGQKVTPEWFKTVGILNNSTLTHVKFVISKTYTDTVEVVNDDNKETVSVTSVTGTPNSNTDLKTPDIPKGYHVIDITDGSGKTITELPKTFGDSNQIIIYHIVKDPSTTVAEVYSDGTPVVPSKTTLNIAGAKVDTGIPELPSGYQITKITVDRKVVSQNEVPTVQSADNQTIVYTIGKMPTDTVKVIDNNGNELVPAISKTGKTGTETGLKTPEIPKGYHVVDITNANGDKVTGVPKTFGSSDNTIIYHVAKDITDKVYVDVKTESGTVLTPSHEVASGAPGSKVNVEMPEIPKDYHIVKVIVDNNVITPDKDGKYELPNTLSDNQNQEIDDHIEVIVAKDPTTIVEEKYQDGTDVVPNKTTINLQGAKIETGLPKLPEGYKVIKITVNGKEVSQNEVPTVQSKNDQTIIYTIGKIITDTVKVVDENNQPMVPEVSVTGVSGDETGLKTPEIPKDYHIVSVTNNGKTVESGVPSKFTNDNQNIVYHIAKDPSTTVAEVYPDGKPVIASKISVNIAGSKVNTEIPELPNGYQITRITVNGKVVSENEVPTVQSKDNQTIVYTIGKMPTDTVKVVDNNGKELVPAVSKTGKTGTETGLNTPEIPKGYHVVDITNGNGDKVTGVPKTFGSSDNTIIYHVAKDITDKVYVDVKTESGTVLTPSHEVASGTPGSKVNVEMPEIPKDYHIVKVIVDGNVITPDKNGKYELPSTLSDNQNKEIDDHIEVIVAKNPTTTVEEVYQDGKAVVAAKTTVNIAGVKVNTVLPELPDGYKITKITVNGKEVLQNEVPTVQSENNQTIIYTIGKISTDTGKIVDGNDGGDIIHHIEKDITDKVYINVVTQSGDVLVPNHQIASGKPGSKIDINIPNIPDDYHITKVIVNDNTLTPDENGNYQLPKTLSSDKSKEVDYNIKVIVAKNTSSTTINEIYSNDNKEVVPSKTITGTVGSKVNTDIPELPDGYKIKKIIVNGEVVNQSEVPTVQGNTDTKITYVIEKIPNKDLTPNNPGHDDTGKTTDDNNHKNVEPTNPSDSTHNNNDHKNNTPDKPNHDNTDNTTDGNHNKVDHNKTNDSTHNNDNHKNNTSDKSNHDNTGNTTDENHNNVGPNKPSDNNIGKTTNDNNQKNVKPTKPVDTGNTEDNKTINPKVDNNTTTPKSNGDINSTGAPEQINELPHTGLSNNDNNVAKEAGVLAGILSTLAALLFFRRKK